MPVPCRRLSVAGRVSFGFVIPAPDLLRAHPLGSDVSVMWAGRSTNRRPNTSPATSPRRTAGSTSTPTSRTFGGSPTPSPKEFRFASPRKSTNQLRVGLILKDGEFEFMAGSHRTRKKKPEGEKTCIYWRPLEDEAILNLLTHLCDEKNSVIVFGEIYGLGVQDLDYGTKDGYRVFDISVNGKYLDWADVKQACQEYGVETVPCSTKGHSQRTW